MHFNPITNQLFAGDGTFIKQLHCPLQKQWEDLGEVANQPSFLKGKICNNCAQVVVDSSLIKESDLIKGLKDDPHTCIKIDLNQENLFLTHQTYVEQ